MPVLDVEHYLSFQNSTVTIEEFHCKLQEATNFPLRPFVIPFLKVILTSERHSFQFVLSISSRSADPCPVISEQLATVHLFVLFGLVGKQHVN